MLRRTDVRVLFAMAAWTVFVWGTRIKNILQNDDDRGTGFIVVHVVLAVISVAFAVAITRIALRARRTMASAGTPEPERERV